jgi:hypothetical protein
MGPELLGILLPLIQNFIKGRSGDELSNMLGENKDILSQLGGTGGARSDSALSALALLLPLLMKQNSVVVMGPSGINPNLMTPGGAGGLPSIPGLTPSLPGGTQGNDLPPPVELQKTLDRIDKRLAKLESKQEANK